MNSVALANSMLDEDAHTTPLARTTVPLCHTRSADVLAELARCRVSHARVLCGYELSETVRTLCVTE